MIIKESTKLWWRDWSQTLVSKMGFSAKQAKHVQGNEGTKNVTFKEAVNIWSISYVMTRKYYLKLTTNVHMNKKNIFNIMCKKG